MFNPTKGAFRFGEGLSPNVPVSGSPNDILAELTGDDVAASTYPIKTFSDQRPELVRLDELRRAYRTGRDGDDADSLREIYRDAFLPFRSEMEKNFARSMARSITTPKPFRERLTRFWADHFTVVGKGSQLRPMVPSYIEEAIRPHISGRFSDMLQATILHPMMLLYLDQTSSYGPNSRAARGRRGLNENLARELLELHTLGVGGVYSQIDVRQLAELLTGLSGSVRNGFRFLPNRAEPGVEQVLGDSYGGDDPQLDDIRGVLNDLSSHPDTAAHIAQKLAVHFVSDDPPDDLVQDLTGRYLDSGGHLSAVYDTLILHPATWERYGEKVKQPVDFIFSSLRALQIPPASLEQMNRRTTAAVFEVPMSSMGQRWFSPNGPDGWPEEASHWVSIQGLAARLQWAMSGPSAILRGLPDPQVFAAMALGDLADARVLFAAENAESRREGIGLVLASPAFQRR